MGFGAAQLLADDGGIGEMAKNESSERPGKWWQSYQRCGAASAGL